jgi:preprotein translocase subunit YajC|tara:strand:+ start:151 stop:297 length:147 start_codon:yes stop_codon:yes gene_type:complete
MVIDWTFIVLVLILVVVLAIAWFIISMDDVNRRNMDKVYKYLEEIRDK